MSGHAGARSHVELVRGRAVRQLGTEGLRGWNGYGDIVQDRLGMWGWLMIMPMVVGVGVCFIVVGIEGFGTFGRPWLRVQLCG